MSSRFEANFAGRQCCFGSRCYRSGCGQMTADARVGRRRYAGFDLVRDPAHGIEATLLVDVAPARRAGASTSFPHRQQHGGVLEGFEGVADVRDGEKVSGGAFPGGAVAGELDVTV